MQIKLEFTDESSLNKVRWRFWVDESNFVLDEYVEEHRESKRHKKFLVKKIYTRIGDKRNYRPEQLLSRQDVVVTKEIKNEVLGEFLNKVKFM